LAGRVIACGDCESCRLLTGTRGDAPARAHPDFHVITKELAMFSDDPDIRKRKLMTIPGDVMEKRLLVPVYRAAQLRHNKVFIVDEAELIREREQNLLLKTLEEPPAGTFIILITSSEEKLLPTIRSRCQRVAFLPLPPEVIQGWAERHAGELPAAARAWLVEFAGGSLGRAELAACYNLAEWAAAILPALDDAARGRFAADLGSRIAERVEAFAKAWVERHDNASKDAANKLAAGLMWALVGQHARRRLAELAAKSSPADPAAAEELLSPWLGVIDSLGAAEMEIAANVNMGIATDHLVSRLYRALSGEPVAVEG
jgi:DNA polymerase-3 subunit delta'